MPVITSILCIKKIYVVKRAIGTKNVKLHKLGKIEWSNDGRFDKIRISIAVLVGTFWKFELFVTNTLMFVSGREFASRVAQISHSLQKKEFMY